MGWFAQMANFVCTKAGYSSCADLSTFEAILLAALAYLVVWLLFMVVWAMFGARR